MARPVNLRYWTLSTAINIIDPERRLAPGTKEHNWVTETILSWMADRTPGEVFRMSKGARRIFCLRGPVGGGNTLSSLTRHGRQSDDTPLLHSGVGNPKIRQGQ